VRSADIQMRELSRLTKETIHLGALDEDSIVYIHKIDSMYNLRMYSHWPSQPAVQHRDW
jgi:IclR family KDG regulon transcriptional repressor